MNNDLDLLISFLGPIKELLLDDTVSEIMAIRTGNGGLSAEAEWSTRKSSSMPRLCAPALR